MTTLPEHEKIPVPSKGGVERKLLVAVDGSVHSTGALHYLSGLFAGTGLAVSLHLLEVLHCQAEGDKLFAGEDSSPAGMAVSEKKRYAEAGKHLATAAAVLVRDGFAAATVTTQVIATREGIADTLIGQARIGRYDALVIGRRGLGRLEQAVLGSVSASVLAKCHDLPLWIVAGHSSGRSFLVPVDNSPHTLMAVDHLAFIMGGDTGAAVTLFHSASLLHGKCPATEISTFCESLDASWCAAHLFRPDSLFHAPEQLLVEGGVPLERIRHLEAEGGVEPAGQILKYADSGGYGTIVMGRRGGEVDKGFFGGISDRVVKNALLKTVWIVG